ncbi:MAG TPA: M48 family metallopeptidase [Candidatus Sulfopaludibacter sp.]|nr:M48 family metallopeptidase [Candidatus Sulfopaludibacter sp.]
MRVLSAAILTLALAAGTLFAQKKNPKDDPNEIGNRDVAKCLNFYSIEKEMALGKQLAEEVSRQVKLVEDPLITEWVNRLGQNLARSSDAKVPFQFQVIDGPTDYNAFALPAGYIFVYTGLIKMADEEDELAGALAHEIAHVAARHLTCRATKQQLVSFGSIPLSVILPGWGGYAARQAAGAGGALAFQSFSRRDESDADYLGVQYMYAAGYDPNGVISIFEKLEAIEKQKPGTVSRLLASHPMDSSRIAATQKEIDRILPSKPEYVVTTSEYKDMRERVMALEGRRKADPQDNKPTLRVNPGANSGDQGDGDRPTLKRHLIE